MTREEAIRCLSVHSSTNGSGLCTDEQHYEAKKMAIKALEQMPSDDEVTITMKRGTLKCSNQVYIVYNKDWFRKHFATEIKIITGYDGYSKQPTSDDCVSRQAVLEKINDWWGITSTSGEPTLCDYIRDLPPVTPTQSSSPAIPLDKVKQAREEMRKLDDLNPDYPMDRTIHVSRNEVLAILDKLIAEGEG